MKKFEDIKLLKEERASLRSFRRKPHQRREEINCFHELFVEYQFIESDYADKKNIYGVYRPLGTYSLSKQYRRYKIFRREKKIHDLPNWVAISISLASLILQVLLHLWLK